jgi:hypothetical protein
MVRSCGLHRVDLTRLSSVFFLFGTIIQSCHASIFWEGSNETFPSLSGLFGRPLERGVPYSARLQFLRENPYLCHELDLNQTTYSRPTHVPGETADVSPIVLLAARGECSFYEKAQMAQTYAGVGFLIVYNQNFEGEDTIVPMFSEYGDSRLYLLSTTHRTGQAMKRLIADQPENIITEGGPLIRMDSDAPDGVVTVADLQALLLSALGLFFMLLSFSGCLILCVGMYGHLSGMYLRTTPSGATVIGRRLLTARQVRNLSVSVPESTDVSLEEGEQEHSQCAVCIDDLIGESDIITLPCHHRYHADCIIAWLTERQSSCPLCKYDVMEYVLTQESAQSNGERAGGTDLISTNISWFDRLWRYRRWTVVSRDVDEDVTQRDGIVIDADEMDPQLEMTGASHFQIS